MGIGDDSGDGDGIGSGAIDGCVGALLVGGLVGLAGPFELT